MEDYDKKEAIKNHRTTGRETFTFHPNSDYVKLTPPHKETASLLFLHMADQLYKVYIESGDMCKKKIK